MFSAHHIKERMDQKPFQPFRICLSDGKHFDITNHDAAFVKRHAVEIGLDTDPDGVAGKFAQCAIIHITRIEDLQPA